MGALKPFLGLLLVALGLVVFALRSVCGLADNNALLFVGLALVVAGTVAHVALQKRQSRY